MTQFYDQPTLNEGIKRFRVVAALIRKESRILLTQRWPNKHLGLMWEFPGGKVEPGETDENALKRELREELGVSVEVGSCCFETRHGYGTKEVHLLIYRCKITEGEPTPMDVKAIEWVEQANLRKLDFPPADMLFVQELVAGRLNQNTPDIEENSEDDEPEIPFRPAQIIRR